jgi:hypothetical protein
MKTELENDYVDVKSADFVKDMDVSITEGGISFGLDVRDYEEPQGEYLYFHGFIAWEPLIEESLKELVDACRLGPDGPIDMGELKEAREQFIANLEEFIDRLRKLPFIDNEIPRGFP